MRIKFLPLLVVLIFSGSSGHAESQLPEQQGYVNDFAEMLSPKTRHSLEQILSKVEDETSDQILVATFPGYGDEPMESFGGRLAQEWKIGHKDHGNGAVLIIFQKELQAWLEAGSGFDDKLPLAWRRKFIRDIIAPYFRTGEFDQGSYAAVTAILHRLHPEIEIPRFDEHGQPALKTFGALILLLTLFLFVADLIFYIRYRQDASAGIADKSCRPVGTYGFSEWWLLYGILPNLCGYVYFNVLIRWINPSHTISAKGTQAPLINLGAGRGRFWGSGISGKW